MTFSNILYKRDFDSDYYQGDIHERVYHVAVLRLHLHN